MSDIFRKFVNILNESVDEFNWICGWIQMNSLMNFNEFANFIGATYFLLRQIIYGKWYKRTDTTYKISNQII